MWGIWCQVTCLSTLQFESVVTDTEKKALPLTTLRRRIEEHFILDLEDITAQFAITPSRYGARIPRMSLTHTRSPHSRWNLQPTTELLSDVLGRPRDWAPRFGEINTRSALYIS